MLRLSKHLAFAVYFVYLAIRKLLFYEQVSSPTYKFQEIKMKKMFFAVLLLVMGMLFSSTAIAHEGESHEKKAYEEGSGGAAEEMGHKADGMAHEYKEEGAGAMGHSKEDYEKKYGKYEHEKKEAMEEGSGMKDEPMRMKEMEHQRKEEGSKM
jgi:hypothetical protein